MGERGARVRATGAPHLGARRRGDCGATARRVEPRAREGREPGRRVGVPAAGRRSGGGVTLGRGPRGGSMNRNNPSKSPWGGWLLHAVIGTGLTAVLAWLAAPPVAVLVAVLAMGI